MKPKCSRQVEYTNTTHDKVSCWLYLSHIHETHEVGLIDLIVIQPYSWKTWSWLNQIQDYQARHILSFFVKYIEKSYKRDQDPILYTHKLDNILYIDIYDLLGLADMI